jgi:hypothetical protein
MSRLNERDIARELAESESFEPPAGLLEKIKAEIPQEVRVGTAVPGTVSRSFAPRQRWLIAASLLMGVGAGIVGLRTWQSREAESLKAEAHLTAPQSAAAKAPPPAAPAVPAPPPPPKADASLSGAPAAPPARVAKADEFDEVAPVTAPKPEAKERRDLAALGYISTDKQRVQQPAQPVEVPQSSNAPSAPRAASPPALEAEGRVENGAVGGAAGAAPAAPAAVAESPAPRQKAVAVDRLSLNQVQALKKEKDQEARRASASRFELAGSNPFVDAITHPVSTFGLDVDTVSYTEARRVLMEGRLPDPASVRVEEWLSAFDFGGPAPFHGDFAIRTEGSPTPFSHGPEYRLLRFNIKARLQTVARNAKAQVEFNSVVVARYRLLGDALYEIELRKDTPHWEQQVATLHLYFQMPGSGATTETIRRVGFQNFAPAWEQASPALRLSTLVAELAEILKGSPWAKQADLGDVARRIQELVPQFPGDPKVAELADLAARAARIKASRTRPVE